MSEDEKTHGDERAGLPDDEPLSSTPPDDQTALGTIPADEHATGSTGLDEPRARPAVEDERVAGSAEGMEAPQTTDSATEEGALLPAEQNDRFRSRWEEIQASFVDEPQQAVEQADALVADLAQRVTASLTKERERLESQWAAGDDVNTEDLRVALTRYRTFFDRLLAA